MTNRHEVETVTKHKTKDVNRNTQYKKTKMNLMRNNRKPGQYDK